MKLSIIPNQLSFIIVILLIGPSIAINISGNDDSNSKRSSKGFEWTLDTDTDFNSGILDNTTLISNGAAAH
jgi:hypothetical protein